jgi:hypothetical protein
MAVNYDNFSFSAVQLQSTQQREALGKARQGNRNKTMLVLQVTSSAILVVDAM